MSSHQTDDQCAKMIKLDRLRAELHRRMCTPEAVDLVRTSLGLKAEVLDAIADEHEAKHAYEDHEISHDDYIAMRDAVEYAIAKFEGHNQVINSFFADIDEQINALKMELSTSMLSGLLGMLGMVPENDEGTSPFDIFSGASAMGDFQRSSHDPIL